MISVAVTGKQLPLLRSLLNPSRPHYASLSLDPPSPLERVLTNPFSLAPIVLAAGVFLVPNLVPS